MAQSPLNTLTDAFNQEQTMALRKQLSKVYVELEALPAPMTGEIDVNT